MATEKTFSNDINQSLRAYVHHYCSEGIKGSDRSDVSRVETEDLSIL